MLALVVQQDYLKVRVRGEEDGGMRHIVFPGTEGSSAQTLGRLGSSTRCQSRAQPEDEGCIGARSHALLPRKAASSEAACRHCSQTTAEKLEHNFPGNTVRFQILILSFPSVNCFQYCNDKRCPFFE